MTRAEETALKAYPKSTGVRELKGLSARPVYAAVYEQAKKEIIAIIESRISELLGDAQPNPTLRYELQDLIKKIKEE